MKADNSPNQRHSSFYWHQRVSRKAYELYQQRGEELGHTLEDWLTAGRLVQEELRHAPPVPNPLLEDDDIREDNSMPP